VPETFTSEVISRAIVAFSVSSLDRPMPAEAMARFVHLHQPCDVTARPQPALAGLGQRRALLGRSHGDMIFCTYLFAPLPPGIQ
jgi:hypothetical protein